MNDPLSVKDTRTSRRRLRALNSVRTRQRRSIDQLRVRFVLTVGFILSCFVLTSVIGIYAVMSQQQLGNQKVAIHDDVNLLLQSMIDQETGLRGYIATNDPIFLQPYDSGRVQYASVLKNLQSETSGSNFRITSTALKHVDANVSTWSNTYANSELTLMRDHKPNSARSLKLTTQGKTLFDTFRSSITQLRQVSDNDLATLQNQVDTVDFIALAGAMLLAIVAMVGLWFTFSRFSLAQREQLAVLQETVAIFGAGDLTARVPDVSDVDLLEVGSTFNTMAATLQEQQSAMHDRDILEQVLQLNSLLTRSLDLADLADEFLHTALSLLDVQVGALYLYNPESQQLYLTTSLGLQKEHLQSTFALGEGLVGRVAQERQSLMITRPRLEESEAFQVKTVLGAVLPSSLYHLPLLQGDELLGVLAVGSMYTMREQTRNVFSVIASNLASAIRNTQAYAHIQEQAALLTERSREQERANLILRQQRDELTTLNAALEEANRARSRFLSTMSHELRTPLTSIIGFGQMLLRSSTKSPLNERQLSNVDRILKNAQHLLALINDVLDLAKVEAGRMDVNATEVDLRDLLNSLVDETRSVAIERSIDVTVDVSDDLSTIETDPMKLRQIILNLLSNSLKFTEKGEVLITARHRTSASSLPDSDDKAEQVMISVKDTGIGIPLEQQKSIFEAFYQVDNSNSRTYAGTGLGLSIVREFTTLLGGKVEIESRPGEGTAFTLFLPLHAQDRSSIQDLRLNTLHGDIIDPQRVAHPFNLSQYLVSKNTSVSDQEDLLVVAIDDNPDVLQLISASLEQSPYRVVGIQDSTQAIELIEKLKPQAITLDIMMPKMNGWQILHQLKSNPRTALIPVILLTVLEDRSAGYVLGADEYLMKPVARDTLLVTLHHLTSSYLNMPVSHPTQTAEPQTLPLDNQAQSVDPLPKDIQVPMLKPILLVHNEPSVYDLLEKLVKDTGYAIQTTENGQDVMALIEQTSPDLLMLFVEMDRPLSDIIPSQTGRTEDPG